MIKADLDLQLAIRLPKDSSGMVRRDTMEDKEKQVQGIVLNKMVQCVNTSLREKAAPIEDDQIMQEQETFRPLSL